MNVHQRFRRIEALLDGDIDASLTEDNFERLVVAHVPESDDLEYKVAFYEGEKGRQELAKDVAALANHVGGVIIVGVAEQRGTAIASTVMPLEDLGDGAVRRVRNVVADRVHPFPAFDVYACSSRDQGKGFLVIVVGRSAIAPHAVSDPGDTALRYWTRSGSQTLPLPETVVSDRYRSRFAYAETRAARLRTLLEEGTARLDPDSPWVLVAVVPEIAGEMRLDAGARDRIRDWVRSSPGENLDGSRLIDGTTVTVGQRRAFVGQQPRRDGLVQGAAAELHSDGASLVAVPLYQSGEWPISEPSRVYEYNITSSVVSSLRVAARHAIENVDSGGEAIAEARMLASRKFTEGTTREMAMFREYLVEGRFALDDVIPNTRALIAVPPSRHTVDLDAIVDSPTEWIAGGWLLAADLLQAFGVAEPLTISREGKLRTRYLGASTRSVLGFAERAGIELDDSEIEL